MPVILGTCSMNTGHASMQARQVVHDHSVSSMIQPPTRGSSSACNPGSCSAPPSLPIASICNGPFLSTLASSSGAASRKCSCRSRISFLGERGLSVSHAGQASWHRPHSVQVYVSIRSFHP
ncbi:MAG TPA: hypothetical protein VND68_12525, partial [Chloroflexia bacterium]|nr:hypothetical protein [Chloroflexia bacterium]